MSKYTILIVPILCLIIAFVKLYFAQKAKKRGCEIEDTSYIPLLILFIPLFLATIYDFTQGGSGFSTLTLIVVLVFGAIATAIAIYHDWQKAKKNTKQLK